MAPTCKIKGCHRETDGALCPGCLARMRDKNRRGR